MWGNKVVYLDGAANTPLDRKVYKKMKPLLSEKFMGNSMSIHPYGVKANKLVYNARKSIASDMEVPVDGVFFTSGATESNNWVIKSVTYDYLYNNSKKNHIICSVLEHDSVLNTCKQVETMGMSVTYIHPSNNKYIRFEDVVNFLRDDTCLVCVMAVNNETGVENDLLRISMYLHKHNIKMLVDCTQALSYGGLNIQLGKKYRYATFFSFSAHKIYGPTGIGCLIVNDPRYHLNPLIIGGAQESGLRGGTSNTASIVGLAAAIHEMLISMHQIKYEKLLSYLNAKLKDELPKVYFNLWPTQQNIVSINCSKMCKVDNLANLLASYDICVSAGSACDANHNETDGDFNGSHVLKELGLKENEMRNTIRVSFTKYTTKSDIDKLIKALKEVKKICELK